MKWNIYGSMPGGEEILLTTITAVNGRQAIKLARVLKKGRVERFYQLDRLRAEPVKEIGTHVDKSDSDGPTCPNCGATGSWIGTTASGELMCKKCGWIWEEDDVKDEALEKAIDTLMKMGPEGFGEAITELEKHREDYPTLVARRGQKFYKEFAKSAGFETPEKMADELGYDVDELVNFWLITDETEMNPEGKLGWIAVHSIVPN